MHGSFDLLDLKIRVPPQLAQRLTVVPAPCPPEEPPDSFLAVSQPLLPLSACMLSLVPLFFTSETLGDEQRTMYSGCIYLTFAPFTVPTLVGFHLHHKLRHWAPCTLAYFSLFCGNVAAVLYCSGSSLCKGAPRLWLVSLAIAGSALQMLSLINKTNVALVMISTALAAIVCCLAVVAPLLPSLNLSYRCYQSTSLAFVWLFWQASRRA
jgi:hypothetical protein